MEISLIVLQDEINANEEHIEHFHKKSVEIQEMLQSQEAPLELQVSSLLSAMRKLEADDHMRYHVCVLISMVNLGDGNPAEEEDAACEGAVY